jgi:uncharacterized protein involved in exopolysaccharide biosynthesis
MNNDTQDFKKGNVIDLYELVIKLWSEKIFILKIMSVFVLIGLIYAFGSTKEYKSEVRLLPEVNNREGMASSLLRQFGGLGGLGGLDIMGVGTSSVDAISPRLYPEVIQSSRFLYNILYTEVEIPTMDTIISIYDYFNEFEKKSVLYYIQRYTIGLPGAIIELIRNKEDSAIIENQHGIFQITYDEYKAIKSLSTRIESSIDQKTSIITISSEFPDPLMSAQVAEIALRNLTDYIVDYRIGKVKRDLSFIQEAHEQAEKEFLLAQNALATFRDKNKNVILASFKSEEERLESTYNLKFALFNSLSQRLEQAKISLQEETPVIQVLEPVQVPVKKSKPKRLVVLFAMVILSLLVSTGIIIMKDFSFKRFFSDEKKN